VFRKGIFESGLREARLFIAPEIFIQVYRNDLFSTKNPAPVHDPQVHDKSPELRQPANWHGGLGKLTPAQEKFLNHLDSTRIKHDKA